jgi:hypothetical protein
MVEREDMDSLKPEITGGDTILPFDKLPPSEFERLCYWLIKREGFKSVKHLEIKNRQGCDITADKDGKSWGFQCKRVQRFSLYDVKTEIDKLPKGDIPDVFVFIVACSVSYYTGKRTLEEFPEMKIDFWIGDELDEMIQRHPDILAEFFQSSDGEPGIRADVEYDEFLGSMERWRSNKADGQDIQKIADVIQSGGVNFGEDNEIRVSGNVIGEINITVESLDKSAEIIDQLFKDRKESEDLPPNEIPVRRKINAFLCHSSDDKPRVKKLFEQLRNDNVVPWLDEEVLLGGQEWEKVIRKAVRSADVVIVCLSRKSVSREGFVQKEIGLALDKAEEKPEGTIYIIPLRLERCNVPDRLKRWHWLNLYTKNGYKKLIKTLATRAEDLGLEPPKV